MAERCSNRHSGETKKDSYHHGDLAAALKKQTLRLVAKHGIEGFSLRAAAAALKVTPGAVYKHFGSKTDLLIAVADDGFAALGDAFTLHLAKVPAMEDAPEQAALHLRALGRAYLGFALADPARFLTMFSMAEECAKRRKNMANDPMAGKAASAPYQILQTVVSELSGNSEECPMADDQGEFLAWSAIHGMAHLMVSGMLPSANRAEAMSAMDTITFSIAQALKLRRPPQARVRAGKAIQTATAIPS